MYTCLDINGHNYEINVVFFIITIIYSVYLTILYFFPHNYDLLWEYFAANSVFNMQ